MAKRVLRKLLKLPLAGRVHRGIKGRISYVRFVRDFQRFNRLAAAGPRFTARWEERQTCLEDQTTNTEFDRHYVYHPAWAARVLARTKPTLHIDISSTLHFSSLVSAFVPVEFYDYRPAALQLSDLSCKAADLLALPFESGSVHSLSCMHVVEHIGLGRYGEPLDPNGDLKAIGELKRVLAPGASLLFVVPMGKPGIKFNAHRIYSHAQISDYFADLSLQEFALLPDAPDEGGLIYGATREMADKQSYGCGCFWFSKGTGES